ncbi:MAG: hypothetical protein EAS52_06685 [Parapedobacter sp.]|nr:MAG: hypothetical protein EAS52_06685 [Parapedobacter sp.]
MNRTEQKYHSLYREFNFERKGLFRLLRKTIGDQSVLYPGCSIHITPSFYFRKVLYIDKSQEAVSFFEDKITVASIIQREKEYPASSSFEFVQSNVAVQTLSIHQKFGLLVCLFAGNISSHVLPFIKSGGYVLTANEFSDLAYIQSLNLKLIGTIQANSKSEYKFYSSNDSPKPKPPSSKSKKSVTFKDTLTYYLFQLP